VPDEPAVKRAYAFIDGQNLYFATRDAFGNPGYDPILLAAAVAVQNGWQLDQIMFYTGVPSALVDTRGHEYWTKKLAYLGTRGVKVFQRKLSYSPRTVKMPDGSKQTVMVGREKGVDIKLALDLVRLARTNKYDVAVIFSQDQDLSEATDEVREISIIQKRWIKLASAFPLSPAYKNQRGINRTDWVTFDLATYNTCLDTNIY
jgi:uncharacterized LabA/DUF88 family protein